MDARPLFWTGRAICMSCAVLNCGRMTSAKGFCNRHYKLMRYRIRSGSPLGPDVTIPRPTEEERFWRRVRIRDDGCWEWTASRSKDGYGQFYRDGNLRIYAHVYSYTHYVGPVPDGHELDHKCRFRACCNPIHLEPVTHRVNCLRGESPFAKKARQTHCKNGHEFTRDNTIVTIKRGNPTRECLACSRKWHREYKRKVRAGRKVKKHEQ